MNRILVVVDMQNDFVTGALGTKEALAIVPHVVRKVKEFDGRVIFTRDTHQSDYLETQEGKKLPVLHCLANSEGWQLIPELEEYRTANSSMVFDKPTFGSRQLGEALSIFNEKKKIDQIILVGLCTDICVISNAMLIKAFLPETPVKVDSHCCAGVSPESHDRALEAMKVCQIEVL